MAPPEWSRSTSNYVDDCPVRVVDLIRSIVKKRLVSPERSEGSEIQRDQRDQRFREIRGIRDSERSEGSEIQRDQRDQRFREIRGIRDSERPERPGQVRFRSAVQFPFEC
ncbi:hypothetical protein HYALB_00002641 [Hymenoscyphus albidus]|uniref:Uncharacterized protein n=1 Tax=Hymenoscyphus albidus TaxID=595503 RepID=A0A9N9LSI2_9HELO|nr:hypothetical protein HYALB_00002641 [Hymenoscyphus albidus]